MQIVVVGIACNLTEGKENTRLPVSIRVIKNVTESSKQTEANLSNITEKNTKKTTQ